ncbi:MAG TPA: GNAT family protein [Acidimicrobiia bacterium]|nr:GNAT family protein [Acidimicrobiia bacterium]
MDTLDPTYRRYDRETDFPALVELLTTEAWTYRVKVHLTEADVVEARDDYGGDGDITELIAVGDELAGFVRAFELGDQKADPQLDFRLRERFRGRGLGTAALHHITALVFEAYPETIRIEGQTRQDNVAMRRAFVRGGYVKEAVYRRAWPDGNGNYFDGIGYAVLRSDWESGTVTPVDWSGP